VGMEVKRENFQYRKYSVVYSNDFKESDLKKTWLSRKGDECQLINRSKCLRKFSLVLVLISGSEVMKNDLPFLGARNCQNK
jgi:hypothetical protein